MREGSQRREKALKGEKKARDGERRPSKVRDECGEIAHLVDRARMQVASHKCHPSEAMQHPRRRDESAEDSQRAADEPIRGRSVGVGLGGVDASAARGAQRRLDERAWMLSCES